MSQFSLCLGIKLTNPQSTTSYEVFPLWFAESHLGEMSAQFWCPFRKIYPAPGLKRNKPEKVANLDFIGSKAQPFPALYFGFVHMAMVQEYVTNGPNPTPWISVGQT